jgi:predicted nucleic acid-binding protein
MQSVYFDTSVFISIFMADEHCPAILELLRELKKDKTRICTSIVTVQEASVQPYRKGTLVEDRFEKINKIARIEGVSKEIALTAAKYEAHIVDHTSPKDREDNKRRKWGCFHLATAAALGCTAFYSTDEKQLKRKGQFNIKGVAFLRPEPSKPSLFSTGAGAGTAPN